MKSKKFIVNNQLEFDKAIDDKANQILLDYKKLNLKKHKTLKKNGFKTELRTKYERLESDKTFSGVLSAIQKIDEDFDEGQTYFDAIKIYIKVSKRRFEEILDYLIEYNSTVKAMIKKIPDYDTQFEKEQKENGTENTISAKLTLDQVFSNESDIEICLDALRLVTPPVIDKNNKYLLGTRKKGAIVAWVEVLKWRGKVTNVDKIKFAEILNDTFLGLNVSSRTLSNVNTTAYKKYHNKLTALIK